jgi:hypothetical protein
MNNRDARMVLLEATRRAGSIENLSLMVNTKKVHLIAYGAGVVPIPQSLLIQLTDIIGSQKRKA